MSTTQRLRGGVYVDGFNLYHAIHDLGKPYLKWLGLRRLAEGFARGHAHTIEEIVFCTAFFPNDFAKRKRHETYISALKATGVRVLHGHTITEPMQCKNCERRWYQPREKETDINVALSMFDDVRRGRVDVVFLLSADTDQASSLRFLKEAFPQIKRIVVTPPGREKSKHLRDLSDSNVLLREDDIDAAVLPKMLWDDANRAVVRPQEYAPPPEWVHPDDRPGRRR